MPHLRLASAAGERLPTMRYLISAATVALFSFLPSSATAAATGTILGQVINESTGRPQPGVELTLTTGTEAGDSEVVETVRSDAKGRYRFEDLVTGEDRFYALDARFEEGLFAGRPIMLPSDTTETPVMDSTLRVWNTTTEPGVIAIQRDDMFVVANEGGLGVIESVTIVNTSDEAYIGRGAGLLGDDATGSSFAFALPAGSEGFSIIESTLDIPELVEVDRGVAATVAFPPGENRATFSYRVPGEGGSYDLSRPALYPTLEMSIYAAAPIEIRSNRLVPKEGVELEGKRYERWSTGEPIDAGDPLQAIAVASGSIPMGPLLGVALGVVLLGMVALFARNRRRRPKVAAGSQLPKRAEREHLLEQVAVLDLALEAGEIDRKRWDDERRKLIGRLRQSADA